MKYEKIVDSINNQKFTQQELIYLSDIIKGKLSEMPNSLDVWMKSNPKILNRATKYVYCNYVKFCVVNDLDVLTSVGFGRELSKKYDYISKVANSEGRSVRVYVKKELQVLKSLQIKTNL